MASAERREALLAELEAAPAPLSGSALAKRLGVSRQVIVGDVGWLRAKGHEIIPTSRGYVLARPAGAQPARGDGGQGVETPAATVQAPVPSSRAAARRVIKLCHTVEQTTDELFTVLENGGGVADVSVSHRAYGTISATLNIYTREDALRFIDAISSGKSVPLLTVTSGYHYHTIVAESEAALDRIERALDSKGYLAPLLPHERPGELP